MIVGIQGEIVYQEPTLLHVDVQGLVYEVLVSLHTTNLISSQNVRLLTTYIIREDAHLLFGFMTRDEKKMFDTLLKINGIGPKVALATCSTFSPETFSKIIMSKDVAMLKRVPGIGPKAASRIMVELADFIVNDKTTGNSNIHEATMALESLGFKKEEISKALTGLSGDTPVLVKEGLRKLQRL
ncbi:MAG TPA: Holliday junction branch migration protein RuvA [Epsilonproteobacteria bacterium]|nr:Holliday junction branch migration protein RuvA [Campylobacterota bacterium]